MGGMADAGRERSAACANLKKTPRQPPWILLSELQLVNRAFAAVHEFGNASDRGRVSEQRCVALVGHFDDIHRLAPRAHGFDRFAP
jgi:hypothetical protein